MTNAALANGGHAALHSDGIIYSCTEQYMMAQKARLFEDEAMLHAIMKAAHPKQMKAFGRAVSGFDQIVWKQNSYDIVKRGNLAKFNQNDPLWNVLKGTKRRVLVETRHLGHWHVASSGGGRKSSEMAWKQLAWVCPDGGAG